MSINHVVCVHLNWFAEIKTGTIIGDHQPMRLPLNISSAHCRKTRQFLKAEKIQRNLLFPLLFWQENTTKNIVYM